MKTGSCIVILLAAASLLAQTPPAASPAPSAAPLAQTTPSSPTTPSAASQPRPVPADAELMAKGRQDVAWLLGGDVDNLWGVASDAMKQRLGTAAKMRSVHDTITSHLGTETTLVKETLETEKDGRTSYTRLVRFAKAPATLFGVKAVFDATGTLTEMVFRSE